MTTKYLLFPTTGQTAQDTTANADNLTEVHVAAQRHDNTLLDLFMDPVLGCTPFQVPDLANNEQPTSSQTLDELLAAKNQPRITALVPENDEMTLNGNGQFDTAKTDLYREEVGQAPINAQEQPDQQPGDVLPEHRQHRDAVPGRQPDPARYRAGAGGRVGDNLLTFLANRLNMSFTNLDCQNFGLTNPVAVTLNRVGAAVAATFQHHAAEGDQRRFDRDAWSGSAPRPRAPHADEPVRNVEWDRSKHALAPVCKAERISPRLGWPQGSPRGPPNATGQARAVALSPDRTLPDQVTRPTRHFQTSPKGIAVQDDGSGNRFQSVRAMRAEIARVRCGH